MSTGFKIAVALVIAAAIGGYIFLNTPASTQLSSAELAKANQEVKSLPHKKTSK